MSRCLIAVALLLVAGCGSSGLSESADAKAIRAYIRDRLGDNVDIPTISIIETGKCGDYAVNLFDEPAAGFSTSWKSPGDRCAVATVGRGSRRLYVYGEDGKISDVYNMYKRR